MELKIDLLEKKKRSWGRTGFGVFGVLFAIVFMIIHFNERGIIRSSDWMYSGFLILTSVPHIIAGLGYTFEYFFGKAYILIDSEIISLKTGAFAKEQSVNWNEIKSMDYKISKFTIKKTDDTTMIIDISELEYMLIQKIKETMDCVTKEKNIQLNFQ